MDRQETSHATTRRSFLGKSTAAVVGGTIAATMASARAVHGSDTEILKVGLIGCGGRGSGAAANAMRAEDNVRLTAMADLFGDRLERSRGNLTKALGDKFQVTEDRCFTGFDAYQQLIDSGVDVVILATSPHYRPLHLRAAIEAGKHVFCEKPVAVDPVGVRHVLESTELARKKGLCLVSGLCWRYDLGVRATIGRIKDGAIGDLVAVQENYLTGTLWHRGHEADWSDMEYQNRNWYYFTWLSGDHIVEQFIHSLDKSLWLMDDQPPAKAFGLGGRQVRTDEKFGNIYDHHAVCYEWDNGFKCFAYTRQMKGCYGNVEDYVLGSKGSAQVLIKGQQGQINGKPVFEGTKPSMYDQEHKELFAAIRAGTPINNGRYMSYSTMMAILGREVCYTGKQIQWDDLLASDLKLGPEKYEWGEVVPRPIALPGT